MTFCLCNNNSTFQCASQQKGGLDSPKLEAGTSIGCQPCYMIWVAEVVALIPAQEVHERFVSDLVGAELQNGQQARIDKLVYIGRIGMQDLRHFFDGIQYFFHACPPCLCYGSGDDFVFRRIGVYLA